MHEKGNMEVWYWGSNSKEDTRVETANERKIFHHNREKRKKKETVESHLHLLMTDTRTKQKYNSQLTLTPFKIRRIKIRQKGTGKCTEEYYALFVSAWSYTPGKRSLKHTSRTKIKENPNSHIHTHPPRPLPAGRSPRKQTEA